MAKCTVTLKIKFPWWMKIYLKSIALFSLTFGFTPDAVKISKTILKHTKVVGNG